MVVRKIFVGAFIVVAACAGTSPPPSSGNPPGGDPGNNGSNGSGSGSDPGGGGMTATQYITQIETKYCAEAFTCMSSFPTSTGDTFADEFGASAQACETDSATYEMPAMVESEITAGKIHYDAAAAAQCVAGITAPAACSDFWTNGLDYPAACDTAMVGTIADGGACVVDFDCSNVQSYCASGKCTVDTGM